MHGLHALHLAGKVMYLVCTANNASQPMHSSSIQGISDTPAWIVSKANQYARDHALTPFSIYQGAWSILQRDFERDIIPMARAEGELSRHFLAEALRLT